jgi:hypothetical protein
MDTIPIEQFKDQVEQPMQPAEEELATFRKDCEARANESRAAAVRHTQEAENFSVHAKAAEAAVDAIVSALGQPSTASAVPGVAYPHPQ